MDMAASLLAMVPYLKFWFLVMVGTWVGVCLFWVGVWIIWRAGK